MSKVRLLLIEDDQLLAEMLIWQFEREQFEVRWTTDGEKGLLLAREQVPDIILLDWMIESVSGLEVCRRLRRHPATANVPIIMLTARGDEADRIRGLETGADDYITKPFSPRELMARIGSVLRRVRPALMGEILRYEDLEMDVAAYRVRRGSRAINFGATEFRLLRHFLEHPERVFSREQLLDSVWGNDTEIELRTVDVHVRRIRGALNEGGLPDLIRTVRSAGYALDSGKMQLN